MTTERYKPAPWPKATKRRWMRAPFSAYDAIADEFAALSELLRARQNAA